MTDTLNIYTLEVAGRAVLALSAEDQGAAETAVQDPEFQDALSNVEHADGGPLWDGKSALSVRDITAAEQETYDKVIPGAPVGAVGAASVVFLVPIRFPTDDETMLTDDEASGVMAKAVVQLRAVLDECLTRGMVLPFVMVAASRNGSLYAQRVLGGDRAPEVLAKHIEDEGYRMPLTCMVLDQNDQVCHVSIESGKVTYH